MNLIFHRIIIILVIPVLISLTACVGAEPIGVPTSTPTQTETILVTPSVTASQTVRPTVTPSPSPSPTQAVKLATLLPPEEINLGAPIKVPEAGFSFKPPSGFQIRQNNGQVTLTSKDGHLVISLVGITITSQEDLEQIMQRFLDIVSRTFDEFHLGECLPYRIGGSNGLSCDLDGKLENEAISGMAIIASPEDDQLFSALAFAVVGPQGDDWEKRAKPVTEKILKNITFFKPDNP